MGRPMSRCTHVSTSMSGPPASAASAVCSACTFPGVLPLARKIAVLYRQKSVLALIHCRPAGPPFTFGGSNGICPMLLSGPRSKSHWRNIDSQQSARADDELDRALDLCADRFGAVKRAAGENRLHQRANLKLAGGERRRGYRPSPLRDHRRRSTKTSQRRRIWTGGLGENDGDDVIAVEVSGFAEERFAAVIMLIAIEGVLIAIMRPAGEGPQRFFHVVFGVIANPRVKSSISSRA